MIRGKVRNGTDEINISSKRKAEDDGYAALEENIKRFRITHTPGEIRLGKDVKGMGELSYVQCTSTEEPSVLLLNYTESYYNNNRIPTRFMIRVSKYYPHQSPVVTCLQSDFSAPFIGTDGEIKHAYLQDGWSAVGTIKTVVEIIQSIRPHFAHTPCSSSNARSGEVTPYASKQRLENVLLSSPDCLNMEC